LEDGFQILEDHAGCAGPLYAPDPVADLHGVQGVECSNHSVPTNRIKDLQQKLYASTALDIRRLSNIGAVFSCAAGGSNPTKGDGMQLNLGLTQHPEHGAMIANIISIWNATEDAGTKMLSMFLGVNMNEATLLAHTIASSRARLDLLKTAGHQFVKNPDTRSAFDNLLKQLGARLSARNSYAHGVYGIENNELYILNRAFDWTQNAKGGRKLTIDELNEEFGKARDTFNQTIRFFETLFATTPPELLQSLQQTQLLRAALG
jgi:hypothetical protein